MRTSLILKYVAGAAAVLTLALAACEQSAEGDRCNPDLAAGESDCNSGLKCTAAGPLCPENYCCPYTADGGPGPSSNSYCQPGCNGGAASICNAGQDGDVAACEWACANDQGDLNDPDAQCAMISVPEAGGGDAGGDGGSTEAGHDSGGEASASDGGSG
jgi:hypothetical protein